MRGKGAFVSRRLHQAWSYARWSRQFGAFGAGTRLGRRLRSRGLDRVFVSGRVQIGDLWRLETYAQPGSPHGSPRIVIGERTSAEVGLHIAAASEVVIAEDCLIALWVFITDHQHGIGVNETPRHADLSVGGPVHVGRGSWLGERCVLMPGVVLGEGCVVGANAVVTKSFPAGSVIAGVPARLLRQRPGIA